MRDADILMDIMEKDFVYTIKSLSLSTGFTIPKTACIVNKMVNEGYINKIHFSLDVVRKIHVEYGYIRTEY